MSPVQEADRGDVRRRKLSIQVVERRVKRGLTQHELGALCGMAQAVISDIENGKRANLTIHSLERLAKALRCRLLIKMVDH